MQKFLPSLQGSKVTQINDSLVPSKRYDQWVRDLASFAKSFYVILDRNKREEKEKTWEICINEPSMRGKREEIGRAHV